MVQIIDIFGNFHHFNDREPLDKFIKTYSNDFDFVYHDSLGEPLCVVELQMIFRDKEKAKYFSEFINLMWDLEEEEN